MKKRTMIKQGIQALLMGSIMLAPLHGQADTPSMDSSLKVMSYNVWVGGFGSRLPLSQTAKVIQDSKAEVVGLQEIQIKSHPENTADLAKLLGWNHDEESSIITRYEITERLKGYKRHHRGGIKVKLPTGQEAYIFNIHLPAGPYQPYQLLGIRGKKIQTEAEAIEWARKTRQSYIKELLKQVRSLPDQDAPVFVVGDFNEPSHLDWTEAAAKSGRHPIKVAYPTSSAMAKAGFNDAYRTLFPDEMTHHGYTWSPAYKADDPTTHHDRIDFIYFKGKGVSVNEVKIVGENEANADLVVTPYPSDHRAVVATFSLPNSTK